MPIWKQIALTLALGVAGLMATAVFAPGVLQSLGFGGAEEKAATKPAQGGGWGGGQGGARSATTVTALPPGEGQIADRVSAIGDGQALRSVAVVAESPGQVIEMRTRSGQKVQAGDVLLQLDSEAETIALERARLMQEDAVARLERARLLQISGTGTDVQLREAELEVRQADLELREAEYDLAQRRIVAPMSGWIGIIDAEIGARIGPQTEIARVDDRSALLVEMRLPERMVGRVAVGDLITAEALAGGFGVVEGRISAIDNRVDPASRTLRVQAELPNPDDRLRAGMAFAMTLDLPGASAPAVDPLSVQWSREGAYVWVVREGKATRLPVRIAQREAERVLVEAAFEPGDLVVIEGVQAVRPGAEVEVRGADGAQAGADPDAKATP
ncbi:MAG: efflux RND transporter periplasmic adaptor subunit [Paracoccaceae bacterium]